MAKVTSQKLKKTFPGNFLNAKVPKHQMFRDFCIMQDSVFFSGQLNEAVELA